MKTLEQLREENTELARIIAEEKEQGATVPFVDVCRALAGDSSNYTEETGDALEWFQWACLIEFDADEVDLLNLEGVDGTQYLNAEGEKVCYTVDDCGFRNVFDEEEYWTIESDYAIACQDREEEDREPDQEFDLILSYTGHLGSKEVWSYAGHDYNNALEAMAGIMRPATYVLPSRILTISDHGNVNELTWEEFASYVADTFTEDLDSNYSEDGAAIYQAAFWCPSDASTIAKELLLEKGWAAYNEDSDSFPQFVLLSQDDSDSPNHCDAGSKCAEASILADGTKVGKLLNHDLTQDGEEMVVNAYHDDPTNPVVALWLEQYDYLLPYHCSYCALRFETDEDLTTHEETEHTAQLAEDTQEPMNTEYLPSIADNNFEGEE